MPRFASLKAKLDHYSAPFVSGRCREWLGGKTRGGYGELRWEGRPQYAHRLAYTEYVGPIPEGMQVLHSCDNRGCVNDEHFFLGTHTDNMADKIAKGRAARGERIGSAKLTEAQALAIRADPRPQHVIAAAYGVLPNNVSRIKSGHRWGWLPKS